MYVYTGIVFVTYAFGCGFLRFSTGCKVSCLYSGLTLCVLKLLEYRGHDAATALTLIRLLAFNSYLWLLFSMLYGRDAMRFLTNWCLAFHIQYFAFGARNDPTFDGLARFLHSTGWAAAFSIYFGFLVSVACGGAVPNDVLIAAQEKPATEYGVSSFIGWIHSSPTLFYVLDAILCRKQLQRMYEGRVLSSMAVGFAFFFSVGQFWECINPNTIEVYSAPPIWYKRGQAFATFLRIGTPEQLKNRKGLFGNGEDMLFSYIVKYGGVAGAVVAACVLNAFVLSAEDAKAA